MNEFKMRIFHIEIARQCDFAMLAENDLKRSFQNMTIISPETSINISAEMNRFWYSAQSLLVVGANISKLFWPAKPRARKGEDEEALKEYTRIRMEDAKTLREALNIDDSSPIKNRKLRDHFEHFDERIAKLPNFGFNYVDTNISAPNQIQVNNAIVMRHFNPDSYAIEYHGETSEEAALLQLEPTMIAIKTLRGALNSKYPFLQYF
jgi:hypothetical protein